MCAILIMAALSRTIETIFRQAEMQCIRNSEGIWQNAKKAPLATHPNVAAATC
jgi:hypothetical protein